MRKCERCEQRPAEWALQYIGDDRPTFTTLGSHYRGFRLTKLCDLCKEALQARDWRAEGAAQAAIAEIMQQ